MNNLQLLTIAPVLFLFFIMSIAYPFILKDYFNYKKIKTYLLLLPILFVIIACINKPYGWNAVIWCYIIGISFMPCFFVKK